MQREYKYAVALVSLPLFSLLAVGLYQYQYDAPAISNTIARGRIYDVKRIKVLEGHLLDIVLSNEQRYLVRLTNAHHSPVETKKMVVQALNDAEHRGHKATMVPRKWDSDDFLWVADVYFDPEHGLSLTEWLQSRGLLYSR